jgi:hypothetical protein
MTIRGFAPDSGGDFPAEVVADIDYISRLVELNPEMDQAPPGYKICDATAARLMQVALDTLSLFETLEGEGHGATHELFKIGSEQFAASTLLLVADRETALAESTLLKRWRLNRCAASWGRRGRLGPAGHLVLSDEAVAKMKSEAQIALRKGISLLEDLSRPASFEAFKAHAEWFAEATIALVDDREGRKQLKLATSSDRTETRRNSKEG